MAVRTLRQTSPGSSEPNSGARALRRERMNRAIAEPLESRQLYSTVTVNTADVHQTIAGLGGNYALGAITGPYTGIAQDSVGQMTLRTYSYLYPDAADANADSPVYSDPDAAAARALDYVGQGFTAVKFDPAGPYSSFDPRQPSLERLELSAAFCRRIREVVGPRCDLLFGTHGQFTVSGAKRLAQVMEPYAPLWFEEPTPPEMPEEMAKVAASTTIPISTGERLTTKYEFARVLACGAASILQMNLGRVGGLLEAKKIAGMAEAHYAQIAPHLYCGPVVGAANIQISTCSPNFLILESIERWDGFQAKLVKADFRWEDGYVIPPEAPGLGIELDEDVARAHPYAGDALHLMPANKPIG